MKNIRQYLFAGISMLMLAACSGDSEPEPQTYTQDIALPSNATEQIVTIDKLSSSIATVENTATWLTVEPQAYSSGSPKVKLRATANTAEAERKCNVTVTATSGGKVILSVIQKGNLVSEIEELHGSQTDKPAYRRQ